MPEALQGSRQADAAALLLEVVHARAAGLARGGALSSAAALLQAALDAGPARSATLDLLARIRAQAGEWGEAEKLWLQVERAEPGHAGAVAGLARLRRGRGTAARLAVLRGAAAGVLAAAGAAMAIVLAQQQATLREQQRAIAALQLSSDERARADAERARVERQALESRLHALAEAQQLLSRQIGESEAARRGVSRAGDRVALKLPVHVQGVRSARQGQALALWLDDEPFDAKGRLQARARSRLRALARAIVMTQERVVVEAVGVRGAAPDEETAASRAAAAALLLRQTGLFPHHAVLQTVGAAPTAAAAAPLVLIVRHVSARPPAGAAATSATHATN